MTKCPLTRGVRLREVSVSGGSTVLTTITDKQNIWLIIWIFMQLYGHFLSNNVMSKKLTVVCLLLNSSIQVKFCDALKTQY